VSQPWTSSAHLEDSDEEMRIYRRELVAIVQVRSLRRDNL
jgi:hypothetical protein